jgi:hypothetical protein
MPEEHTGPYLQMAALCQMVLQEPTGQLSLIRLTDSVGVSGQMKEMQPHSIMLHAVVSFRAGFAKGKYIIRLVGTTPSRTEFLAVEQGVFFEGEDRGVNAIFVIGMVLPEEGVYWFDIFLNGTFVTRVPLRVLYQQVSQQVRPPAT